MKSQSSLPWLLAALLQAMPLLRQVALDQAGRAPGWVYFSRLSATAIALLGGYDAVSGASVAIAGPFSYTGTVNQPFPSTRLVTVGQAAQDWRSNPSPFASGLTINSAGRITGTPTLAGTYLVTMTAYEFLGAGGASVSAGFTFVINGGAGTAPAITVQPVSQTTNALQNVTFSVTATGTAPLAYQWQFNGNALQGGTNSALALSSVTTNHAGDYRVVITNAAGAVTSSIAALTVNRLVPGITWTPPPAATYGTTLGIGQLNASAGGVPGTFTYNPSAGTLLGAGTRPLSVTFTPTDNSVFVPNSAGVNWLINPATLTITANNQSRLFGQANPPLTVSHSGFVNGETPSVLTSPAVASTLADLTSPPGTYPITASGAAAANYAINYVPGTLTVTAIAPAITASPTNVTAIAGTSVNFNVGASGAPLNYQWFFNGTNALTGATNAALNLTSLALAQSGSYSATVTNAAGSATSAPARLIVTTALLAPQPLPSAAFLFTNGFPLNIALEIGQTYRIEASTNLVNWLMLTNFTSTAGTLQFLDSAATNNARTYYRVVRP